MSCQISLFSNCGDIERIKRALYLLNRDDLTWLKECKISLSSCGSLLAVAHGKRVCFLTAQWISSTSSNIYLVSWNGSFDCEIASVFTSPVSSQGQSSQNVPDWICVMIGMQNGDVNFYTDHGHFLMKERFENGSVRKITCHTGIYGNDIEEIHIVHQSVVCIVQGSSLFQTLRYVRSQLAKVQAGVNHSSEIDGRNIQLKKWLFTDHDIVADCAVVGLDVSNTFDHLLSASMYGGYETIFRSVPPHNTLILAGGSRPFLGFHYALEGGVQPPLQDVAKAVASKIISNLPIVGWFGSSKSNNKDSTEKQQRAESLVLRSSIQDLNRQCLSISLSPDRKLAAVADNLGRVSLVDLKSGLIIRIFKGYRDAQCGFVHVFDEKQKNSPVRNAVKHRTYAVFLIIYTPKKGIIDIRLMTTGERISSFTTSRNGILLYNTNGLLGTVPTHSSKKLNTAQYSCVLMDPDGKLKQFLIPFHYALDGDNSKSAKDVHLLRRLKQLTKEINGDTERLKAEIVNTVNQLETVEIKKSCIEQVISDKHIPPICILVCIQNIVTSMEGSNDAKLSALCVNVRRLMQLFMHLNDADMEEYSCECYGEVEEKDTRVDLTDGDFQNLQRLLDLSEDVKSPVKTKQKVMFASEEKNSYSFLNSFAISNDSDTIELKDSLSKDAVEQVAFEIFNGLFKSVDPITVAKWRQYIKCGNINPETLIKLLIAYWMSISLFDISKKLNLLGCIIYEITTLTDDEVVISYNEVSPWWERIREVLVEASSPIKSMTMAMMCKEVAQIIEKEKDLSGEVRAWETVTKDCAKWSLLIGKLDDISLLSIVLSKYPSIEERSLPEINIEAPEINLRYVYNSGRGSVAELISKWLCVIGIHPEVIRLDELKQNQSHITETVASNINDDTMPNSCDEAISKYERKDHSLFYKLDLLRKQFPYSTLSDNLILNMCWEYASAWIKNISELRYLDAVLLCLENITCSYLCLGVCSLVWSTHLKRTFESTCKLLNKVGKLPKERLCLQDVGLSDVNIVAFVDIVMKFLSKSISSAITCDHRVKPVLKFENIWDKSVLAFNEIVLDAPVINFDTLHLNFQVASVLYYQCFFNIKFSKPLNMLFDCDLHVLFDSTSENYTRIESSFAKVKSQRLRFIKKLVLASLDLVTSVDGDGGHQPHIMEMTKWLDKLQTLARLWRIESDFLRREQVTGLYELGYDSVAEDIFTTVTEPSHLVNNLILLCGTRLKHIFESSSEVSNIIASLPPQLMAYLQTLEGNNNSSADVSLESTKKILENITSKCSADPKVDSQQKRLVSLMLDACNTIGTL